MVGSTALHSTNLQDEPTVKWLCVHRNDAQKSSLVTQMNVSKVAIRV